MSTPLDQLDGGGPPTDEQRMRQIMATMNASELVQQGPSIQPMPQVITEPPLSTSMGEMRMDPGTTRGAHILGGSQPTMADFQAMAQHQQQQYSSHPAPHVGPTGPLALKASLKDNLVGFLRAPVAVAILVFLLNLPVVTSLLSRYVSWMYLSSGEISVGGLLVKSLLAAVLFAVYQGVATALG